MVGFRIRFVFEDVTWSVKDWTSSGSPSVTGKVAVLADPSSMVWLAMTPEVPSVGTSSTGTPWR
jgi:hypothetical protein